MKGINKFEGCARCGCPSPIRVRTWRTDWSSWAILYHYMRLFVCNTLSLNFSSKLLWFSSQSKSKSSPVLCFGIIVWSVYATLRLFFLSLPLSASAVCIYIVRPKNQHWSGILNSFVLLFCELDLLRVLLVTRERERETERMSKAGALDLASGLGGKIEKTEVLSAVEQ